MGDIVTFFIGNGFDLQLGLKTRYTDFYAVYITNSLKRSDSDVIINFKKTLLKDCDTWANFELAMGENSTRFTGEKATEDFMACYNDFVKCFIRYINIECSRIDWKKIKGEQYTNFVQSIRDFPSKMETASGKEVKNKFRNAEANFILFNYTNVFENFVHVSNLRKRIKTDSAILKDGIIANLGKRLHVHGEINKFPTIGVNDPMQIRNEALRTADEIKDTFIKQNYIKIWQGGRRSSLKVQDLAIEAINNSSVICSFGASIGDTDKFWWELLGDWLQTTEGVFIIIDQYKKDDENVNIEPGKVRKKEMKKEELKNRFIRLANLDPAWEEKNPDRIIVEMNTDMFDIKIL